MSYSDKTIEIMRARGWAWTGEIQIIQMADGEGVSVSLIDETTPRFGGMPVNGFSFLDEFIEVWKSLHGKNMA